MGRQEQDPLYQYQLSTRNKVQRPRTNWKKKDKAKDRQCLQTTLANTIPKAWKEFGHMEEYDSPTVIKDIYANFILHVHEKQSLVEQGTNTNETNLPLFHTDISGILRWMKLLHGYYPQFQICQLLGSMLRSL